MSANLNVALIFSAVNRTGRTFRGIVNNFGSMEKAAKSARATFDIAGQINQAAEASGRLGRGMLNAVKAPLKLFIAFEDQMLRVKGLTSDGEENFNLLQAAARKAGNETRFTALQAAEGMEQLAISGLDAADQAAVLTGVLNQAIAGQVSIADSAKLATATMGQFGLQAKDMGMITDILTATFTSSRAELGKLKETLKFVGPEAKRFGISLADTAAIAGILAQSGIESSQGGTSLRRVLQTLKSPTTAAAKALKFLNIEVGESGEFKDFIGIIGNLQTELGRLTSVQREAALAMLFQTRGAAPAGILIDAFSEGVKETGKSLQEMRDITNSAKGTTDDIVKVFDSGAAGGLARFNSKLQETQLTMIEDLSPALNVLIDDVAGLLGPIREFIKENPRLTKSLIVMTGTTGLAASALSTVFTAISTVVGGIGIFAFAIKALGITSVRVMISNLTLLSFWLLKTGTIMAVQFVGNAIKAALVMSGIMPAALLASTIATIQYSAVLAKDLAIAFAMASKRAAVFALSIAVNPITLAVVAVSALALAVGQLVKHWNELSIGEGLSGILDAFGEGGVLSTLGDLFDPKALINDVGGGLGLAPAFASAGAAPAIQGVPIDKSAGLAAARAKQAGGESRVGGVIELKIDSPTPVTVTSVETEGGIDIEAGPAGL